jgi:hypothetical protein
LTLRLNFGYSPHPHSTGAGSQPEIHTSGGQRGLNIRLSVKGLAEITRARVAAISEPELEEEEIDSNNGNIQEEV